MVRMTICHPRGEGGVAWMVLEKEGEGALGRIYNIKGIFRNNIEKTEENRDKIT